MSERPRWTVRRGAAGAATSALITALITASGCGGSGSAGSGGPGTAVADSASSASPSASTAPSSASASSAPSAPSPSITPSDRADPSKPLVRPAGPLSRKEAQRYAFDLLNRDRAKQGLPHVKWDDTAMKAGERHAKDMAAHGYTAHIGTDGSTPEHRHTEAGGAAMVMENVACFADGLDRELDPDPDPLFSVDELERIERTFIEEVPPGDGHKRNILTPWHTSVGIGLAKTKGLDIVCLAQEFVDDHGQHDPVPRTAKLGASIKVSGTSLAPAVIAGVGLARVDRPKPMKADALLKTHVYAIPKPYVTYFPKGYKTPIPLLLNGSSYSIEVPLNDRGKPGLYELSVWANVPQTKDLVMISLRTILVD